MEGRSLGGDLKMDVPLWMSFIVLLEKLDKVMRELREQKTREKARRSFISQMITCCGVFSVTVCSKYYIQLYTIIQPKLSSRGSATSPQASKVFINSPFYLSLTLLMQMTLYVLSCKSSVAQTHFDLGVSCSARGERVNGNFSPKRD